MPISRPCPKCQQPLSIPEPIPEKLQCPKCGTLIKFKTPAAPAQPQSAQNISVGQPASPVAAAASSVAPVPARSDEAKPAAAESLPSAPAMGIVAYLHTV